MAKKKKDEGHDETEAVLSELEKEINAEYAKAEEEVQAKLDDYLERFQIKDQLKKQAVENGQITQAEYEQWRVGQIAVGERWEEMKDTIATDLTNTAEIAKSISYGHMPEVYAINHNYGTFQVEKASLVDTSYTLYDSQSVERLFKGGKFYHSPGKLVSNAIDTGKQKAWDKRQVQSVMTQALLQGESIGKIATRLAKTVGDSDRKACIRNARTMTTGVENAGRTDSYKRAEKMGIKLKQEWLATLDSRTRHEHRMLDGQRVAVGEKFKIDGYELEYPGDPSGEPSLIYNCRCTLVPVLDGFEADSKDLSLRHNDNLKEETYDEWKESKEVISHPITKQDSIADTMKNKYNNEYREYAGKTNKITIFRNTQHTFSNDLEQTTRTVTTKFKLAETLDEAKEYAEKTLGLTLENFDSVNLDYANILNETITDFYNVFTNLNKANYLDEIRVVAKNLSYEAGYSVGWKGIILQKRRTSAKNIVTSLAKEARYQKENGWWSTGNQYTLIRHELGHSVQHLYLDDKAGNPYGNSVEKRNKITKLRESLMTELGIDSYKGNKENLETIKKAGEKLSYYGLKDDGEFVAEAVAEYMDGNPRDIAKKVVAILKGED